MFSLRVCSWSTWRAFVPVTTPPETWSRWSSPSSFTGECVRLFLCFSFYFFETDVEMSETLKILEAPEQIEKFLCPGYYWCHIFSAQDSVDLFAEEISGSSCSHGFVPFTEALKDLNFPIFDLSCSCCEDQICRILNIFQAFSWDFKIQNINIFSINQEEQLETTDVVSKQRPLSSPHVWHVFLFLFLSVSQEKSAALSFHHRHSCQSYPEFPLPVLDGPVCTSQLLRRRRT